MSLASLNAGFAYDNADRLKTVSRSGDAQSFVLDTVGNRTSSKRVSTSITFNRASNSNRLNSISGGVARSFVYDAAGNLASEAGALGSRVYSYDGFDRLAGLSVNGTAVADYRAARVKVVVASFMQPAAVYRLPSYGLRRPSRAQG